MQCCGEYPRRFPFHPHDGARECCDPAGKVFNSSTHKCCNNGSLAKINQQCQIQIILAIFEFTVFTISDFFVENEINNTYQNFDHCSCVTCSMFLRSRVSLRFFRLDCACPISRFSALFVFSKDYRHFSNLHSKQLIIIFRAISGRRVVKQNF